MLAYLIDPENRIILKTTWDEDWRSIGPKIGARLFDVVVFNNNTGDSVFVDDEGLFVDDPKFFSVGDYPGVLAGKGLVLGGPDDEGKTTPPRITFEELIQIVRFRS